MVISTGRFNYDKRSKCFSADISELQYLCKSPFQPIPNSKHQGLTLLSQKTNICVEYYIHEVVKDDEGDVMYWVLFPTNNSIRNVPNCRGTQIRIYND